MIREAKVSEIRKVTEFMKAFEKASSFVKVDIDHAAEKYERFVSSGAGTVLIMVDEKDVIHGGLGFITYPDLHSGFLMAVETFWYVSPEYRGRGLMLVREFERRAKEKGCKYIAMIHMTDSYPEELEHVYAHMKYRLVEKHYMKEI
jgi:GNAT superfamily N-acetyltransferase